MLGMLLPIDANQDRMLALREVIEQKGVLCALYSEESGPLLHHI